MLSTSGDRRIPMGTLALSTVLLLVAGCQPLPGMTGRPDVAEEFTPVPSGVQLVPPNDADVELPPGVRAATVWTNTDQGPPDFSTEDRHESPGELVDSWTDAAAAQVRGFGGRPTIDVEPVGAQTDSHAAFMVHVGGLADDSVVGAGYFLVLARDDGGWFLDDLFMRGLCARGAEGEACL